MTIPYMLRAASASAAAGITLTARCTVMLLSVCTPDAVVASLSALTFGDKRHRWFVTGFGSRIKVSPQSVDFPLSLVIMLAGRICHLL